MSQEVKKAVQKRIVSLCVLFLSLGFLLISSVNFLYEVALNYIDAGEYKKAATLLLVLPSYKDSNVLGKYAEDQYEYDANEEEFIESYTGSYDSKAIKIERQYQKQIDQLYKNIREKRKALYEKKKYEEFGDSLPYEGMDKDDLKYTKLGEPDSVRVDRGWTTYARYKWYDEDGKLLAEGTAAIDGARADDELFSFEYYGTDLQ